METESLERRLYKIYPNSGLGVRELGELLGVAPSTISRIFSNPSKIKLRQLNKIGYSLELIPIIFYKDEQLEDLEIEGFIDAKINFDYVGKVFERYINLADLSVTELAKKVGVGRKQITRSGLGDMYVEVIERIATELELDIQYLVEPRGAGSIRKILNKLCSAKLNNLYRNCESIIGMSEHYLICPITKLDFNVEKFIEYGDKIAELNQAVKIRYEVAKRRKSKI